MTCRASSALEEVTQGHRATTTSRLTSKSPLSQVTKVTLEIDSGSWQICYMKTWDWKEHISLVAGAVTASIIAVRLLSISAFNPETAYGVLQSAGTASIIVGSIVSLFGPLSLVILVTLIGWMIEKHIADTYLRGALISIIIFFGVVTFLMTPIFFSLIYLSAIPMLWFSLHLARSSSAQRSSVPRAEWRKLIPFAYITLIFVFFEVYSPPWLPSERLEFKNAAPAIGYIVARSSDDLTILTDKPREIRHYDPKSLIKETVCSLPSDFSFVFSVYSFGWTPSVFPGYAARYPKCTVQS